MSLVDDNSIGGFSFIWTIRNFSQFKHLSDVIYSPQFVMNKSKWRLLLYLKENFNNLCLQCLTLDTPFHRNLNVILSIRASNGLFKKSQISYYKYSLELAHEPFENGHETYLENDELTLRCRMWIDSSELSQSLRCYATTKMKVTKITYAWKLKSFVESETQCISNHTTGIPSNSCEMFRLEMNAISGVFSNEEKIELLIKQIDTIKPNFLTCKVSLLDAEERVAYTVNGDHFYEKSEDTHIWTLPIISKLKLLEQKDLFLPQGTLSLRLEFSSSTGTESSEVKRWEYGKEETDQLKIVNHFEDANSPSKAWADNFQRFYLDGKFSDVIVRTSTKAFPVHKAILCAQSEVFSAMFDRDMKENQTGVVEIEDLDDDTLQKLLLFIYTGTVKDLEWGLAPQLYYAADKYEITELKNECSNFFGNNLVISKVCDVLVLANRHEDKALKSTAQDFIVEHVDEVINSKNWKKLMKENSCLTSETMHLIISRNLKCGHIPRN